MSSAENPTSQPALTLGVLIVTFRRVGYLKSCLAALLEQTRCPDKIWVVYRAQDDVSRKFLEQYSAEYPIVQALPVYSGGAVAGINRALAENLATDLVCVTHDNAVPSPTWLAGLEAFYHAHPAAGAVGGRDIMFRHQVPEPVQSASSIGVLTPWGDLLGNHHLDTPDGQPRLVHYLKGANMSFRRSLLPEQLDTRLLGTCSHYEVDLCLNVRQQNYEVWFDPSLTVDHHLEAPGFEDPVSDERAIVRDRITAYLHNRMLVLSKYHPGFSGFCLLLSQMMWYLPRYSLSKKGVNGFFAALPRLYQAAWLGWSRGKQQPRFALSKITIEHIEETPERKQTSKV